MAWFSKKKAEPTLFETLVVANTEKVWGWLPKVWYQDLEMVELQNSGIVSEKEIHDLALNLFPVDGLGALVIPTNFEFTDDAKQIKSDETSGLRDDFVKEFSGTEFFANDSGGLATHIENGQGTNNRYTPLLFNFYKDSKGFEFGHVSFNAGFFSWPFSSDFVDLGKGEKSLSDQQLVANGVSAAMTRVRTPIVLASIMAFAEGLASGAKKNFYKAGRSALVDKSRLAHLPKPKYRVLSTYAASGTPGQKQWDWAYFPQVLEIGWTFTAETLKDPASSNILANAPTAAFLLFSDGCLNHSKFMDDVFATPSHWAQGLKKGVYSSGEVSEFKSDFDYNGSPNSLAYSHWLDSFSRGRVSFEALSKALVGQVGEEERIARGNLSLAHLMLGDFEKSESLARSVLSEQHDNSEAVYVLEKTAELAKNPNLLELTKAARPLKGFEEYDPPAWLTSALTAEPKSDASPGHSPKDEEFLEKLCEQFIEIVRVIDKLEFATVEDDEGLRPWVQIFSNGDTHVSIIVGNDEKVAFKDFPWFVPSKGGDTNAEYEIPRDFFSSPAKVTSLLSDLFDSFNGVELEIEPIGSSAPEMKTLFPVKKRPKPAAAGLAAAGVGGAVAGAVATTYTTRFFFAASSESDSQEPPSFDWF